VIEIYAPRAPEQRPIVWTIAGSDSCGGAGIQADLKTFAAMGVHGCTVIAALTAQNTGAVTAVESVSAQMLEAQINALKSDMPPRAIKIGMLGNADSVRALAENLKNLNSYVVCDPVMIASSGRALIGDDVVALMKEHLLPLTNLLTPNVREAEALSGVKIANDKDVVKAAMLICLLGTRAVIIKGWNNGNGFVQDFYQSAAQSFWLTSPRRRNTDARGTGCSFASAIAAAHALSYSEEDAVVMAKASVNQFTRLSQPLGQDAPILTYQPLPCTADDFPWLTADAVAGRNRAHFPDCGDTPLGFYPLADSADWLRRLLPLGVTTAQLRIKDKTGAELENEIRAAIAVGREYNCRLFINDHWEIAIKHKAYGIHLGQEDIEAADIAAIVKSGLRLGLSTHSYAELARAVACQPSYHALGPIFQTSSKVLRFGAQGLDTLCNWRRMLNGQLVAIGGITLENAREVLGAGATGIAVISDVSQNANPEARTREWLNLFGAYQESGRRAA